MKHVDCKEKSKHGAVTVSVHFHKDILAISPLCLFETVPNNLIQQRPVGHFVLKLIYLLFFFFFLPSLLCMCTCWRTL